MENKRPVGSTVALVVTVLFGAGIGILGILDVSNLGTVAAIGAVLIGAMWVVVALARGSAGKAG